MNAFAKKIMFAMAFAMSFSAIAHVTDEYSFMMRLNIPRIYDNMESLGYRKYQYQTLKGTLLLIYSDQGETIVKIKGLVNWTHKVKGKRVTYECYDYPYDDNRVLVVGIGSNKTLKFPQGGICFSFVAEPSYNIGEVDEDNTLMLQLSGHGTLNKNVLRTLRGSVSGRIGCGCTDYGHISPTRLFFGYLTDTVYDIAPLDGTFNATFKKRYVGPVDVDGI